MAAGAMPAAACRTAEPRMYPLYKDKNRKTRGALMWLRCFCAFFAEQTTKNVEKMFLWRILMCMNGGQARKF
ncbi:hypothetical protein [Gemmiger sp.]|uniref:hypothetical protein n=1 Tax=Gemmiger sp. TaxID=2049027 RepID=UPI003521EF4A